MRKIMTEQQNIIVQLLDNFRPVDPHTVKLLEQAFQYTGRLFLSGPHIIVAALHHPDVVAALQKTRATRSLADMLRQSGVPASLQRWIDFPSDHSPTEHYTYGLVVAFTMARELAGNDAISPQQLLYAIAEHDIDVKTAIAAVRDDISAPNFASSFPQSWPGNSWVSGFGHALSGQTTDPPTRREATTTLLYAKRHLIEIEDVLNELAQCEPNQVLVVRGLFGSPRQRLQHILADVLVHPTNTLIRQSFSEFHHVFFQDVSAFHAASTLDPDGAVVSLRYCLGLARALHAILVLTRGELLTAPQFREVNLQLLGALLHIHDVPVVISYEDDDELASKRQLQLPLINYREVDLEPHRPEHAVPAVHDYYDDYWRSIGVTVEQDALNTMLLFEPALYALSGGVLRRKVLPYSAADLLNATVHTIRSEVAPGGAGYLKRRALTAQQRVDDLINSHDEGLSLVSSVDALHAIGKSTAEESDLRDEARKLHAHWQPICEMLLTLPQKMQELADHSHVRRSPRSLHIVTQDMVTAQLLSDPQYHLHLMKAFEHSVRSAEPRLLPLIERYSSQNFRGQ